MWIYLLFLIFLCESATWTRKFTHLEIDFLSAMGWKIIFIKCYDELSSNLKGKLL